MKRQIKILEVLDKLCTENLDTSMVSQYKPAGFTAQEVAENAGFSRSNVSSDLNELHRQHFVVKIVSRSTYYVTVKWVEHHFPVLTNRVPEIVRHQREFVELITNDAPSVALPPIQLPLQQSRVQHDRSEDVDPFKDLIGAYQSLKMAVEQAKAGVLYPPKGLDTLLVGPTGVGKTLFAEYMYKFACSQKKILPAGQFVVFNCADYAHNPQLLMSQLFGHIRGAFTGADKDKVGLVEKADGGMLFLDEVHRLPPEGQEMLFYLLDRGDFRRMGDSDRIRHVTVRVVAATTENPDSALLKTFLRRIPVLVQLPELSARPLAERFELIKFLLAREAIHIQSGVIVSQEALWALLLYRCIGNIGQLRNDLQLVCAKAFLHRTDKDKTVKITYDALAPQIKQAIVYDAQARLETNKILCTLGSELLVEPSGMAVERQSGLPRNFYQTISERMHFLRSQGIGQTEIVQCIEMDVDNYFNQLNPKQLEISPDYLQTVLPKEFLVVFDGACNVANGLGTVLGRRLYYALAVHTAATVERIRSGLPIVNPNVELVATQHPQEYMVAEAMSVYIGSNMDVVIPRDEIGFIALMLATFEQRQAREERRVAILVITHGHSTASSMVDFCNKLLGISHAQAIDMPMEANVDWAIEKAIAVAQEIDEGKGILLLVDMGSLSSVAKAVTRHTGIIVKSVELVSTLMVLHVLHKAILPQHDINAVYRAAWTARSMPYATTAPINELVTGDNKDKAIVTTCLTGQGTALKIKALLEKLLHQWQLFAIRVIAVEGSDREVLENRIISLMHSYDIVASIGSIDPEIADKPHIALEDLIQGGAGSELRRLLTEGLKAAEVANQYSDRSMDWEVMRGMVAGMLDEFLTFVNPRKVLDTLMLCIQKLEEELTVVFSSSGLVRMLVHSACMIERLITHASISYPEPAKCIEEYSKEYFLLKQIMSGLEEQFMVVVTDEEICHLIEIINLERKKPCVE